ncbi:MAG TPA: tripartite tricarboxylate transporter TctB family protein [Candidatus Limnocylindria bacterium]|nr:tripartite tricarboxylate transporter TctB family protein [Candidatus Limnocylindria bacterium]
MRSLTALDGRGALLFSLVMLVVFAYAAFEMNTSFTTRARLLGNALIIPALVLAVLQVARELRRTRPSVVPPEAAFTRSALAWAAAFFVSLWALGLVITIPLFAIIYLRLAAREAWPKAALYAIVALLFVQLVFERLLHVPLPGGAIPLPGITN